MNYFKNIFFLFFLTLSTSGFCQSDYYGGGIEAIYSNTASQIIITAKKTDREKNTYISGYYNTNGSTFSIAGNSYTCSGAQDAFLIKVDISGNIKWHCVFTAPSTERLDDIAFDSNENPVILGFVGTADVLIKTGSTTLKTLYTNGGIRPFLITFNKTSGTPFDPTYLINKGGSSIIQARVSNLYIDNNNIIITGLVKGSNFTVGGEPTLYSSSSTTNYDLYILKGSLSPFNISLIKLFPTTSTGTGTFFNSILKTTTGYYFTGSVFGTTLANATVSLPTSTGNRVLANSNFKYDFFTFFTDLSLNGLWALQSIGTPTNNDKQIQGTSLDNLDNLYLTGYNKSSSFNIESIYSGTTINSKNIINADATGVTSDGFLLKYNSSGKLMSYKTLGDSYNQSGFDIQSFGNKIVQSGYFNGSLIFGKDTLKSSSTTDQNGYLALFDTTNLTPIGAVQIKGTGTENAEKFYYNGSDFNPIIGTLASTAASSVTLKTAGGDVVLTNTAGKSIYVANACPIIGIFETPTTTNLYVDPSKPQTGTIDLDVKGDVLGGYSYQWSKKGVGFSRSSSLTNLGPDTTYTVKVDYLGSKCSKTRSFTVLRSITEKSTAFTNSKSCAAKDGTITAVVTNNTNGKYTVVKASIDSATWFTGTQSGNDYTFNFPGLTKGDYQLYYRLSVGGVYHTLVGSKIFIDETGNPITWNSTTVNPIRCNGNTGSIAVSASGSGSLTYSITTSSTPVFTFPNPSTGLTAGTYLINIEDGACEYRAAAVNLTNPAPLTINSSTNISTCFSGATGGISVKAEGGTIPYQYQLTDGGTTVKSFQTSNVFSGLAESSTYTVTVKDVYGCTSTPTSNIDLTAANSSIGISPSTIVSHYYSSIIPGKIIIIPEDVPNSTYTYKIDPTGYTAYTQTQSNFENLLPNNYIITILHNAGCSYSEPFVIKDLNQAYPLVYRKPN
jgi:hypothetical protein